MANGARLGWLLRPEQQTVEIWRVGCHEPEILENPTRLEGGELFPGLELELEEIWQA